MCPPGVGNASCPYYAWNNSEFATIQDTPQWQQLLFTFVEQRQWSVDIPLSALPASHPIAQQAPAYFDKLRPSGPPSLTGYTRTDNLSFAIGNMTAHVSGSGGLDAVNVNGLPVSSITSPFAGVLYQLFDGGSYTRFLEAYANCDLVNSCSWAFYDYGKGGLDDHSHLGELSVAPMRTDTYVMQVSDRVLSIVTNASFPVNAVDFHVVAGTPAQVWTEYRIDGIAHTVTVSLTLIDKTATRIPEALWLVFNSTSRSPFMVNKLGVTIDPTNVVYNGSSHLHGTVYDTHNELMTVNAHNAPLLCVGSTVTPFPTPLAGHDTGVSGGGVSFNLVNNAWGTNYCASYPYVDGDGNMFFMFDVQF